MQAEREEHAGCHFFYFYGTTNPAIAMSNAGRTGEIDQHNFYYYVTTSPIDGNSFLSDRANSDEAMQGERGRGRFSQ